METRNTGRIKKYGVCLNDKCEKYKVIQEIQHGDHECPECKKKLSPCAPPKKKSSKTPLFICLAAVVIIGAIIGGIFAFSGDTEEPSAPIVPQNDSIAAIEPEESPKTNEQKNIEVNNESANNRSSANTKALTASAKRNKDLGYAYWKGALKNGQPNDENGTMTFKETHLIDSRDPQKREAQPGDYIIGEYADGKLVQGIWYDKSNTVKGSIIIGR